MATASTGWYCGCSASVTATTNTTATITVTCYWVNNGWNYNISYVSAWVYCGSNSYQVMNSGKVNSTGVGNYGQVSCGTYSFTVNKSTTAQNISCYAKIVSSGTYVNGTKTSSTINAAVTAKPSYTISYNANGGSGAPSSQTKWYDTSLTLSTIKPTRTGYTFKGWATSSSGSIAYASGATYTANATITLYAVWSANTYSVTYNANGGSGAPSSQTKTYGIDLTLSDTKPTRTNYNFLGWGTSTSATTVSYASGATYTGNAALSLYAIWEIAYIKPRITDLTVQKCDADGNPINGGTYVLVNFNWATDLDVSSIVIKWKVAGIYEYPEANTAIVDASGLSGTVAQVIGGSIDPDSPYDILIIVSDSTDNSEITKTLEGTAFPIDIKPPGNAIAIGKEATVDGALDVYMQTIIRGTTDVSAEDSSGQLIIGNPESFHIAMDNNEIMAKNDSSTAGQLNINTNGGVTSVGGPLTTWDVVTNKAAVTNQSTTTTNDKAYFKNDIYISHNKFLYGTSVDGTNRIVAGLNSYNSNDQYLYGYGSYNSSTGDSFYDGNKVHIRSKTDIVVSSTTAGLSSRQYGINKILWTGAQYMTADHTITLSEGVKAQPNGIVLVWSAYVSGALKDYNFVYNFIPKQHVIGFSGSGINVCMFTQDWNHAGCKYLYIGNTSITGHASNNLDSTGSSVDFDNQYWVLRQVIGV